jgi:uncharacterized protein YjiS (DUF1127 family)
MASITIDSGRHRDESADMRDDGKESPGVVAGPLRAALGLASTCRDSIALAMMSERDLDDLGLLPWEVRSEDWQKESAAGAPRPQAA